MNLIQFSYFYIPVYWLSKKLGFRVIHGCRFQICNQTLHIGNIFVYNKCPICDLLINILIN